MKKLGLFLIILCLFASLAIAKDKIKEEEIVGDDWVTTITESADEICNEADDMISHYDGKKEEYIAIRIACENAGLLAPLYTLEPEPLPTCEPAGTVE